VHAGQAAYAPLVDMLSILLFFMLRSFSMDSPVRPDDPDFRLPSSSGREAVRHATQVDVTSEAVYLDGERIASVAYYLAHDDALIPELYEDLQGGACRSVSLRADGRVPYELLRKVIFTAQEAGVERVDLVAVGLLGM
jgi:biopolymer transport protein ExbD